MSLSFSFLPYQIKTKGSAAAAAAAAAAALSWSRAPPPPHGIFLVSEKKMHEEGRAIIKTPGVSGKACFLLDRREEAEVETPNQPLLL